jgi:hypothetical protein
MVSSCSQYKATEDESYNIYNVDLYQADEETLKSLSLSEYEKLLGFIPNEKSASKAAAIVLDAVYGNCSKEETPFIVKLNKTANAWVVYGTFQQPLLGIKLGGVGYVAIKKDTGEVIMVYHTK